jgi:hypothetical protein
VHTSPAAVSWGYNRIDIFYGKYEAGSTSLRWKRWDPSNGGWMPEIAGPAGRMRTSPSVTSPAPGMLNVFYQGAPGELVQQRYDGAGWALTAYTGTPFTEDGSPASVSMDPSTNIVMVRGASTNTVWARALH